MDLLGFDIDQTAALVQQVRQPLYIVQQQASSQLGVLSPEQLQQFQANQPDRYSVVGMLPALYPEWLGSAAFLRAHGARFPYIMGAMANGIATADLVIAAAKGGCLSFFGAGGLVADIVEKNIVKIKAELQDQYLSWGSNLIHSPNEPAIEQAVTQLYLDHQVHRISASAYMNLTPNVVHYACKGLYQDQQGNICRQNFVVAKLSRPEVAQHFMSPAPEVMLAALVEQGKLTAAEAQLARYIPVAQDITIESDSGGHTDGRPLGPLFSSIKYLAEKLQAQYQYAEPIRLGAAGGIGTPQAVASAFALGADYVLTGTINQSSVEAGLSELGKQMLTQADIADVAMAAAADMFELGVELQVLKRGCLFAKRSKKLYQIYKTYSSIDEVPDTVKADLEKSIFRLPLDEVWQTTVDYFKQRDPSQIERAEKKPKYKMALLFRWYLGSSSRWAITGEPTRKADYQIWCGPAMGAFNSWVAGSHLELLENRNVMQIAYNMMEGAAIITRAQQLRSFNMSLPPEAFHFTPRILG